MSGARPRPLLVTFHCGAFFLYFAVFLTSLGIREVVERFDAAFGPSYIPTMLCLLGSCFAGYLALWNLRRVAFVILLLAGIPLLLFGLTAQSRSLVHALPLLAVLTSLPLWPLLR